MAPQALPSTHSAPKMVTAATSATVTSTPLVQPVQVTALKLDTCGEKVEMITLCC